MCINPINPGRLSREWYHAKIILYDVRRQPTISNKLSSLDPFETWRGKIEDEFAFDDYGLIGRGRLGGGGEGGTQFVHGRSRMTMDPRIPTLLGRSTSGFHQPGRHCLHQARSAGRLGDGTIGVRTTTNAKIRTGRVVRHDPYSCCCALTLLVGASKYRKQSSCFSVAILGLLNG